MATKAVSDAPGVRFYTLNHMMAKLGVKRTTLFNMRRNKEIPGEMLRGDQIVFFGPVVDQWMTDQAKKAGVV